MGMSAVETRACAPFVAATRALTQYSDITILQECRWFHL